MARVRPQQPINTSLDLSERAQSLFKHLVEAYLNDGFPIGSQSLVKRSAIDISSATVRNIMVDLEHRGLVSSPHVSSGKVPTQEGLRLFVDSLISVQPLDDFAEDYVREELSADLTPQELVESASHILSEVSQLAGLVTTPGPDQIELRHVEFLKLSGNQILAIFVLNEREVENRVVTTEREYNDVELRQAANYINQEFSGHTLASIRIEVLESMKRDQSRMNDLLQTALDVATRAFSEDEQREHDYVVSGERNLVKLVSSSDEVRKLLDAFSSKSVLIDLLDECIRSSGVQLFIGTESGYDLLDEYSLISAPYRVDGKLAGVLGVIGPTRMSYQKVIPLVDVTSKLLGHAMEKYHPSLN